MGSFMDLTEVTKFLGISVDHKLTWRNQIDTICKKLHQFSYVLYNLRKIVNEPVVLTAYQAYVTSTLRYGIIFWANSVDRELVFKAQKRCIRSLCGIQQLDSCKPYFKKLRILTLPCLYIFEIVLFVKGNSQLFQQFKSIRLRNKINSLPSKTALFRKSIFGMAPKIFNKIPNELRNTDDMISFKSKLFKFLVDKAYYSISEFLLDDY